MPRRIPKKVGLRSYPTLAAGTTQHTAYVGTAQSKNDALNLKFIKEKNAATENVNANIVRTLNVILVCLCPQV